ncbi:hypothetical protein GH714_040114 [Hevea brasiliensis]|uniref:C2H2-type domain-containing protein n=1 Tax=Hevea brasiliensis TaxID=3981 RepID=A0A6A6MPN3_HEVBR|nr:hypothetical protein GH714_040114 [Hevea brasiliensis]
MPVAKLKASNNTDVMKTEKGNDSLDAFIRQAIGKEPFLSFSRAGDSPVQWMQLLHALDQQDLPGWPLLTPLKVQMQKCEKCSREFCSSINYRRHIRVHHRLKKLDKDCSKNRDLLRTFWDKLSEDEAMEILSFKDVTLEEVPGSSIVKSLMALVRKPGFSSLPQYCLRAGSALLDIIQGRPSRFPLSSEELLSILDDASEKTFMCGTAVSMQKYIFDGEAGKIGLETKNLVACTSFLVEQKLVKAWLADKDAESLRCQKLLVEEEEAAQRRQAELLERKRQKKLRQKEQKAKEHRQEEQADLNAWIDNTVEAVPSAEQSFPLIASDSGMNGLEALPDHVPSSFEPFQLLSMDEDVDLEIQTGSGSDPGTSRTVERQTVQRNSRRHLVVAHWHLSAKSQWNYVPNGFHANQNSQAPKLSAMQKHGNYRDSKSLLSINGNRKWSRKPKPDYSGDVLKTREGNNLDGARDDFLSEHQMPKKNNVQDKHNRPDSAHCSTNRSTIKLWRPVSRNGIKGPILVENGDRESQVDGITGKGDDYIPPNGNCLSLCSVDDDHGGMGNSFPLLQGTPHPGSLHFSCQAKAFLAERWKEAIAAEHVKLALSPDLKSSECMEIQNECLVDVARSSDTKKCILGNVENQLVGVGVHESSTTGASKAKLRTKPDKGVKLKYIPKQRTIS